MVMGMAKDFPLAFNLKFWFYANAGHVHLLINVKGLKNTGTSSRSMTLNASTFLSTLHVSRSSFMTFNLWGNPSQNEVPWPNSR